jgi:hypothetical protein
MALWVTAAAAPRPDSKRGPAAAAAGCAPRPDQCCSCVRFQSCNTRSGSCLRERGGELPAFRACRPSRAGGTPSPHRIHTSAVATPHTTRRAPNERSHQGPHRLCSPAVLAWCAGTWPPAPRKHPRGVRELTQAELDAPLGPLFLCDVQYNAYQNAVRRRHQEVIGCRPTRVGVRACVRLCVCVWCARVRTNTRTRARTPVPAWCFGPRLLSPKGTPWTLRGLV